MIALAVYVLIAVVSLNNLRYAAKRFEGRNKELFSVSQSTRIAYLVLLVAMVALSQQYNHFFYIFAALSARLKYLTDELDDPLLSERQNQ